MEIYSNVVVIFHFSDMILCAVNRCVMYDWTGSIQLRLRIFFLRDHNFKMCRGGPKWPNTCKCWLLNFCCFFCCRNRNHKMFCDRKRAHNSIKHIRRNEPSIDHYTIMHGQHNIQYTLNQYNKGTEITCNEYVLFFDSWPKIL